VNSGAVWTTIPPCVVLDGSKTAVVQTRWTYCVIVILFLD
jgi:hypothetical protein